MSTPSVLDHSQRRLLWFLGAATFFDGFDFIALTQLLPNLRAAFGLSPAQGGALVSLVNVGALAAWFLTRITDRVGRRRVLATTIVGYTLCTLASGLAPTALVFGLCQLLARMFLIVESSLAMVYAAEEFPAARRGLVMGVVQGCLSLGMVVCAAVVPLLLRTPAGWRSVYVVGTIPIILVAIARRSLPESRRFAALAAAVDVAPSPRLWRGTYRRRVLLLGLIWTCTYTCTQTATAFWKEFAVTERGFSDLQVGAAVAVASLAAMPLVFATGRFLDAVGRRRGGAIVLGSQALATLATYTLHGLAPLTVALVFGILSTAAAQTVLNAYTTELFPTRLRGQAFAWANNLLGRIGYVAAPLLVGRLAMSLGWSASVRLTVIGPLVAVVLILAALPETRQQELEITAAAD